MIKPEELVKAIVQEKHARANNKGYEERARTDANDLLAAKNEIDRQFEESIQKKLQK